jgi:hypothetical protein
VVREILDHQGEDKLAELIVGLTRLVIELSRNAVL